MGGRNLTLPERRSLSTSPWDLEGDLRYVALGCPFGGDLHAVALRQRDAVIDKAFKLDGFHFGAIPFALASTHTARPPTRSLPHKEGGRPLSQRLTSRLAL